MHPVPVEGRSTATPAPAMITFIVNRIGQKRVMECEAIPPRIRLALAWWVVFGPFGRCPRCTGTHRAHDDDCIFNAWGHMRRPTE